MRAPKKASLLACVGGASIALLSWCGTRRIAANPSSSESVASSGSDYAGASEAGAASAIDDVAEATDPTFRRPSGETPAITCDEARSITAQVGEELAFDPPQVRVTAFASAAADWIDPHGFWAASSTSPPSAAIAHDAAGMAKEILASRGECSSARDIGRSLEKWVDELRSRFDARLKNPKAVDRRAAVTATILDDATLPHAEIETVETLADRLAVIQRSLGNDMPGLVTIARDRYFPAFDAEAWSHVVLAAAVRAYVPLIDPHGAWAPLDEESSVYAVDLDAHPPALLVDTAAAGLKAYGKYPISAYPELAGFLAHHYLRVDRVDGVVLWRHVDGLLR